MPELVSLLPASLWARRRRGLLAGLLALDARYRSRRALARLDAARLRDIGLDPGDIARETGGSAWDAPQWWRS